MPARAEYVLFEAHAKTCGRRQSVCWGAAAASRFHGRVCVRAAGGRAAPSSSRTPSSPGRSSTPRRTRPPSGRTRRSVSRRHTQGRRSAGCRSRSRDRRAARRRCSKSSPPTPRRSAPSSPRGQRARATRGAQRSNVSPPFFARLRWGGINRRKTSGHPIGASTGQQTAEEARDTKKNDLCCRLAVDPDAVDPEHGGEQQQQRRGDPLDARASGRVGHAGRAREALLPPAHSGLRPEALPEPQLPHVPGRARRARPDGGGRDEPAARAEPAAPPVRRRAALPAPRARARPRRRRRWARPAATHCSPLSAHYAPLATHH